MIKTSNGKHPAGKEANGTEVPLLLDNVHQPEHPEPLFLCDLQSSAS